MKQEFEFSIRQMRPEDAAAAAEIEQRSFSEPWSEQGFLEALNNPNTWCIKVVPAEMYPADNERSRQPEGSEEGHVLHRLLVGYCILYLAANEAEIAVIAVAGSYRGRGIADAMLTYVKEQMPARGIRRILLDVRPSNLAARALYEKHGFLMDGLRKNFYRDPKEDAVLMSFDTDQ